MKRASVHTVAITGAAGTAQLTMRDMPSRMQQQMRWFHRALLSWSDHAALGSTQNLVLYSYGTPVVYGGAGRVGAGLSGINVQHELPIHSPTFEGLYFMNVNGAVTGTVTVVLEWDDGTPPSPYQEG